MLALSIRQPFAELILRGIKKVEYRSRPTRIIGERFWIYASKKAALTPTLPPPDLRAQQRERESGLWSRDLSTPDSLPRWMLELAEQVKMIEPGTILPTGVIVRSAVVQRVDEIADCQLPNRILTDVERMRIPRKPKRHPQPVWFKPF